MMYFIQIALEKQQHLEKALEKPDFFNPPPSDNFDRVSRSIEVLFCGAKVLGVEQMLRSEMATNMTRPKSDLTKVNMNYNIVAPHTYQGRIGQNLGFKRRQILLRINK